MGALIGIAVGLIAILVVTLFIVYYIFGPHTIFHGTNDLVWTKCQHCSYGTQWLWPDGHWGPFQPHSGIIHESKPYFDSGQANSRRCPYCQAGGWWHDPEMPKPEELT